MTENTQVSSIMNAGMKLLRENLGLIEAEIFICTLKNDSFDYTEWSQNLYKGKSLEELMTIAVDYEREHAELIPINAKVI